MSRDKSAKTNHTTPGDAMNQKQFEQMIRKAEEGPFYTIKAVKNELAKWKAKYFKYEN